MEEITRHDGIEHRDYFTEKLMYADSFVEDEVPDVRELKKADLAAREEVVRETNPLDGPIMATEQRLLALAEKARMLIGELESVKSELGEIVTYLTKTRRWNYCQEFGGISAADACMLAETPNSKPKYETW